MHPNEKNQRPPLSPQDGWLCKGCQVLHFRPVRYARFSQALELTSGELIPGQAPLLKRRNESNSYNLRVGISGAPLAPVPASRDALIPGTPYHASSEVACTSGSTGKAAKCKATLIRRGNNSGTVVVTNPEGQKRQFLFVNGKEVASDQPEKLSVQRRGDGSVISLGENFGRYEIVDALVVVG